MVSNSFLNVPRDKRIVFVQVESGPDKADDWIAENVQAGDVVITTDIPLADRCLKNGARVLGPRGREFSENSIGDALATRDLMDHLRMMGVASGGPPPFEKKSRSAFLAKLHEILQAQIAATKN